MTSSIIVLTHPKQVGKVHVLYKLQGSLLIIVGPITCMQLEETKWGAICLFHGGVNYSGLMPKDRWKFYQEEASRLKYCKAIVRGEWKAELYGEEEDTSFLISEGDQGQSLNKVSVQTWRLSSSCTEWQVAKQWGWGPRRSTESEQFQKWYISRIWSRGKVQIPVCFRPNSWWLATAWKGRENRDGGLRQSFSL